MARPPVVVPTDDLSTNSSCERGRASLKQILTNSRFGFTLPQDEPIRLRRVRHAFLCWRGR